MSEQVPTVEALRIQNAALKARVRELLADRERRDQELYQLAVECHRLSSKVLYQDSAQERRQQYQKEQELEQQLKSLQALVYSDIETVQVDWVSDGVLEPHGFWVHNVDESK